LSKINLLIDEIRNNPLVKRYKELESIIDSNEKLQKDYQDMLEKQKQMVNAKEFKRSNYEILKHDYETHKNTLLHNIVIEEYLELQSIINDDLQAIQAIITTEINKELE